MERWKLPAAGAVCGALAKVVADVVVIDGDTLDLSGFGDGEVEDEATAAAAVLHDDALVTIFNILGMLGEGSDDDVLVGGVDIGGGAVKELTA